MEPDPYLLVPEEIDILRPEIGRLRRRLEAQEDVSGRVVQIDGQVVQSIGISFGGNDGARAYDVRVFASTHDLLLKGEEDIRRETLAFTIYHNNVGIISVQKTGFVQTEIHMS